MPQGVYNTVQVNWGIHQAVRQSRAAALTLDRNTVTERRPTSTWTKFTDCDMQNLQHLCYWWELFFKTQTVKMHQVVASLQIVLVPADLFWTFTFCTNTVKIRKFTYTSPTCPSYSWHSFPFVERVELNPRWKYFACCISASAHLFVLSKYIPLKLLKWDFHLSTQSDLCPEGPQGIQLGWIIKIRFHQMSSQDKRWPFSQRRGITYKITFVELRSFSRALKLCMHMSRNV